MRFLIRLPFGYHLISSSKYLAVFKQVLVSAAVVIVACRSTTWFKIYQFELVHCEIEQIFCGFPKYNYMLLIFIYNISYFIIAYLLPYKVEYIKCTNFACYQHIISDLRLIIKSQEPPKLTGNRKCQNFWMYDSNMT